MEYPQIWCLIQALIDKKDYDYIEYRVTLPERFKIGNTFMGASESKSGKLIPLDRDCYDAREEVLSYEGWSNENVENGLTVVIHTIMISV